MFSPLMDFNLKELIELNYALKSHEFSKSQQVFLNLSEILLTCSQLA